MTGAHESAESTAAKLAASGSAVGPKPGWLQRRGPYRVLMWALSGVAFLAGPIIGMNVHAQLGAAIWLGSAVLALIPFASHGRPEEP